MSNWIRWVSQLRAHAQAGLQYSKDPFDRERFEHLLKLAAEIAADMTNDDVTRLHHLFRQEPGPATPKIDVRSAVVENEQVLLVRDRTEGLWTLPGGWVDVEETPSTAAIRELKEESGFCARVVKLVGLFDRNKHNFPRHPYHIYKIIFLCELTGGAPSESHETDHVGFFGLDALPPLSTSRTTEAQIRRIFDHAKDHSLPTYFD